MNHPRLYDYNDVFTDPELYEAVGAWLTGRKIDRQYVARMAAGQSHEEATIGSRRDAGVPVNDNDPIAAQNASDVALIKALTQEKTIKEQESKINDLMKAGERARTRSVIAALIGTGSGAALGAAYMNLLNENDQENNYNY